MSQNKNWKRDFAGRAYIERTVADSAVTPRKVIDLNSIDFDKLEKMVAELKAGGKKPDENILSAFKQLIEEAKANGYEEPQTAGKTGGESANLNDVPKYDTAGQISEEWKAAHAVNNANGVMDSALPAIVDQLFAALPRLTAAVKRRAKSASVGDSRRNTPVVEQLTPFHREINRRIASVNLNQAIAGSELGAWIRGEQVAGQGGYAAVMDEALQQAMTNTQPQDNHEPIQTQAQQVQSASKIVDSLAEEGINQTEPEQTRFDETAGELVKVNGGYVLRGDLDQFKRLMVGVNNGARGGVESIRKILRNENGVLLRDESQQDKLANMTKSNEVNDGYSFIGRK